MKRKKAGEQEGGGREEGGREGDRELEEGGEEESTGERDRGETRVGDLLPSASCCCSGSHWPLCSVMMAIARVFRLKSRSAERGPLLAHLNKQSVSMLISFFYFQSENIQIKQYIIL